MGHQCFFPLLCQGFLTYGKCQGQTISDYGCVSYIICAVFLIIHAIYAFSLHPGTPEVYTLFQRIKLIPFHYLRIVLAKFRK